MVGYWLGEEWSRLSPALHRSFLLFGLAVALLLIAGLVLLEKPDPDGNQACEAACRLQRKTFTMW